jgi:NADPH-dependent 2,4-dienoyl-CoA reductase/sulfur reductase-like enzyme
VIATTRIVDLDHAERIVASGRAQAVGMTRALIADPDLVRKAVEGRAAETVACIGCNQACIGHYHDGTPIACVVNPATGRERRLSAPPVSAGSRSVLVVGAGPGGLSAALEAARAGHRVTLVERDDDIGGQWRLAGACPAHRDAWARYERMIRTRLEGSGIRLVLGEVAAPDRLDAHDACILATGARPLHWEPPASGPRLVGVPDAIRGSAELAGAVLVADWGGGWSGLDAAEMLAGRGLEVTLATASLHPGERLHHYQRNLYLARLDVLGVRLLAHWEIVHVERGAALRHLFSRREMPLPDVEAIVVAQGREPDDGPWREALDDPRVVRVGDVLGPRSIEEAILEGALAARAIA